MTVNEGGRDHHERIIAAKRYDRFGNILRRDQSARANYHASPLIGARESPRTKPPTNLHPAPLGCCNFTATRQKETAQRPKRRLPQCAIRRGLNAPSPLAWESRCHSRSFNAQGGLASLFVAFTTLSAIRCEPAPFSSRSVPAIALRATC
jgi:hypothetical protein